MRARTKTNATWYRVVQEGTVYRYSGVGGFTQVPGMYLENNGWHAIEDLEIENPTPENPEWGVFGP